MIRCSSDHQDTNQLLEAIDLIRQPSACPEIFDAPIWNLQFTQKDWKNWKAHWQLDGLQHATVTPQTDSLTLSAGPEADNSQSVVLWTRESFAGDIKIEYDYTRLDHSDRYVNFLYLHATGKGEPPYVDDISAWSALRSKPFMNLYYENMNLIHISYAVMRTSEPDYIRVRCYPVTPGKDFQEDTAVPGTYYNQGMFETGQTYHITTIKRGMALLFRVTGAGLDRVYQWDLSAFPNLTGGRIGLRQMQTRMARYANFKVFTKPV